MRDILFVLGAVDPEMIAIAELLARHGVPQLHARANGKRVHPANAYDAPPPAAALEVLARGGNVYLVECVGNAPAGAQRIDHHFAGDPGHGQPPARFWPASSLGQTVAVLDRLLPGPVEVTQDMKWVAAADHCLGAAYAGLCPGIDPDALLQWHVASRAAFEHRSLAAVLCDVVSTQRALHAAPRVTLAPGIVTADMREQASPELLIAAAHARQCCLSTVRTRDGRTKIGCLVGSPQQIRAFMQQWAPTQQLTGIYGDPARGFAGAYAPVD